ncbi:MAG: GTP cyclohydrolase II [Armatimonadota bacterium]
MAESAAAKATEACRGGEFVILVDDEARENQGDLMIAAELITPEALNFMIGSGRGPIYVAAPGDRLDHLRIPLMTADAPAQGRAPMCIPVDARSCTSGGASVSDRVTTIRLLASPESRAEDLVRPGHVIPLRAAPGGVLQRAGHTEAAVDLARLAGLEPVGVICQTMRPDGTMLERPELEEFGRQHGIGIVSIKDLIEHRHKTEKLVEREHESEAFLPTAYGEFRLISYRSRVDGTPYLALVKGDPAGQRDVLVRMHSGCVTGDVFHSLRCDCGEQLARAMQMIDDEGLGVIVYIQAHEGRGIGLDNKVKAYHLQDEGKDTVEANEALGFPPDFRDYGVGAQVLVDLGITTMRMLTNNPKKLVGLEGYGLKVVERVPIEVQPTTHSQRYLAAKRKKLGHLLSVPGDETTDP